MSASNRSRGTMSFRRRLGVLRGDLVGRLDYMQFATCISSLRRRSVAGSATQHSQPETAPPLGSIRRSRGRARRFCRNPTDAGPRVFRTVRRSPCSPGTSATTRSAGPTSSPSARPPLRRRDLGRAVRAVRHAVWAPLRDARSRSTSSTGAVPEHLGVMEELAQADRRRRHLRLQAPTAVATPSASWPRSCGTGRSSSTSTTTSWRSSTRTTASTRRELLEIAGR